jgi:hypothetical protein
VAALDYTIRPISDRTAFTGPASSGSRNPFDADWSSTLTQGWQQNVRAIALGLEALRKVDRYGITRRREQYTGFRALPPGQGLAPSGMTTEVALELLREEAEITRLDASLTQLEAILRRAKANAHPDANAGDRSRWNAVDEAEQVLRRAGRL